MTFRISVLPLIAAALLATATTNQNQTTAATDVAPSFVKKTPGTPTVTNLVTQNGTIVGTATIVDDQDLGTLSVSYQLNAGYRFERVQTFAGALSGIPVGVNGNPRPGQFAWKKTNFGCSVQSSYSVIIPLAGLPTEEVTMLVHAKVYDPCDVLKDIWAEGVDQNDNGGWAMRFSHVLEVR
jgi:hypothetical protein